jgi:hypothetical protein
MKACYRETSTFKTASPLPTGAAPLAADPLAPEALEILHSRTGEEDGRLIVQSQLFAESAGTEECEEGVHSEVGKYYIRRQVSYGNVAFFWDDL